MDNEQKNTGESQKSVYFKTYGRIALIFFIGLSAYLVFSTITLIFLTKPEKEVRMPNVVGKQFMEVSNSLIRKGLTPQVSFYDVFDVDNGLVLGQHPAADDIVYEGSKVKLTVSRSLLLLDVPNLAGIELPFAINKLKNLHMNSRSISLVTGVISYIPSEKSAENIVIDQSPKPGEKITPDRKVNLLVSAGTTGGDMKMPNVTGQSIDLCFGLLTSKGLVVQEEIINAPKDLSGTIVSQNPEKGKDVKSGDVVKLKVNYFQMKDRLYYSYEKIDFTIPSGEPAGIYEAYVEDNRSKRLYYSMNMKAGEKMSFVFHRTGNARVNILQDKKTMKVIKFNVEEFN
jgi:beta-lactam-binding protein with PASTA domain